MAELDWNDRLPMPSLTGAHLEIRISNAYDVRDQLKDLGYRFERQGRYWVKSVLEQGFRLDAMSGQPWAQNGIRIEVLSEAGELVASWPDAALSNA